MKATVLKVNKAKAGETTNYNTLQVKDCETQDKHFIFAFDTAHVMCPSLSKGDIIECDLKQWQSKSTGKKGLKITSFAVVEKADSILHEIQGIVGSLDVHEACGKGQQMISLKLKSFNGQTPEKNKKAYVTIPRDGRIARETRKGDWILVSGIMNQERQDRVHIKQFKLLDNKTIKRMYERGKDA